MMKTQQNGAISLYLVSIVMMLLTLAAVAFFYFMRYGHMPLQDVWQRWGKSGAVITNELKEMSGVANGGANGGAPSGKAATVDAGIRRCTIHGKVIFSDVECTDSNPSTRAVKLYDSKGGEPPKAPVVAKEDAEPDLKLQMIDKAIK
jgi:hypothetical protein